MPILKRAREYLAANAAESGADVLIAEMVNEIERLRTALNTIASGAACLPGYSIADAATEARSGLDCANASRGGSL